MLDKRVHVCLILGLLSVLPFLPGFNHDFVYDDHGAIVENPFLLDGSNLIPALTMQTLRDSSIVDGSRPAVIISYFIDKALWGDAPYGYRITNYLLHAAATMLVFLFMARLFVGRWLGIACAILFAWHPLAVEPVHAPAFREDLLCMVGGMVFLLCAAGRTASGLRHAVSILGYILALLSKETAIIIPLVIGAKYWLFPDQRLEKKTCPVWVASVVVLSLLWVGVTFIGRPVQAVGAEWNGLAFRGLECVWSAPSLALWYLQKLLIPFSLSVDYVIAPVSSPMAWRFFAGTILLITGAILSWVLRKKNPGFVMSLAWVFLMFIPVSNVFPLLNPVADRYAYMMLPGYALAIVSLLQLLRRSGHWVVAAIAAIYFVMSVIRVGDWRDDETLWSSALVVEPQSARANTWLGLIEKRKGNHVAAFEFFSQAEQLNPRDPSSSINKAVLVGEMGDLSDAETRLRDVLRQFPDNASAKLNLAHCLRLQGREAEASTLEVSVPK